MDIVGDIINGLIAIFTAIAAGAAWKSAKNSSKAAAESAKIADRQVRAQITSERAWLVISPIRWDPPLFWKQAGDPSIPLNTFDFEIRNVGRTPAHVISIAMIYYNMGRAELDNLPENPEYRPPESMEGTIIVPDDAIKLTEPLNPNPVLEHQEVESIRANKRVLYFYARVEYADAFGESHETRVGYVYYFPQGPVRLEEPAFKQAGPSAYNRAT
jgi:hypothetical protein